MTTLRSVDDSDFIGPTGAFLTPLEEELQPFELEQDASMNDKQSIDLTMSELERQRELVRFYYANNKYWFALECGCELFVNRVLYELHGSDVEWLSHDVRGDVTRWLGKQLQEQQTDETPSPPAALRLWDALSTHRNAHAHAGFKEDPAPTQTDVKEPIESLCNNLTADEYWTELL